MNKKSKFYKNKRGLYNDDLDNKELIANVCYSLFYTEFAMVNVLDLENLFAGKLHAILCRNYKNNVKGRDYYDYIFFINKRIKPNLSYLRNKLIESNKINESEIFNIDVVKKMLSDRFNEVDFSEVKKDAQKFTIKNENLDFYCKDLFIECLNNL